MNELEALQQALATEHGAIYVMRLAGGRAATLRHAGALQRMLADAYSEHLTMRSWLENRIGLLGAAPVTAELTYPVSSRVDDAAAIRTAVTTVEQQCVAAYLALIATTAPRSVVRRTAITAQAEAAVRSTRFGASPVALPGFVS